MAVVAHKKTALDGFWTDKARNVVAVSKSDKDPRVGRNITMKPPKYKPKVGPCRWPF